MATLSIMDENRAEGEFLLTGPGKAALAALLVVLSAAAAPGADHREPLRNLPPEREVLYLPEKYAACVPCHPRPVFEDEDFNVDTDFRDTRLGKNLHWMHVFRQPQGTNCRACHVADDAAGKLGYPSEVRFEMRRDGGTCSPPCHRTKEYKNAGRKNRDVKPGTFLKSLLPPTAKTF